MSVQIYDEVLNAHIGGIFKNITNENSYNLLNINQHLTLKITLKDPLFIYNNFFYINYEITNENKIVYETKDKLMCITLSDLNLSFPLKIIDKKYIYNCCEKYKKDNELLIRTNKINYEIIRLQNIENKIKTEIIYNLNFGKNQKKSHFKDIGNKINGKPKYNKSMFLYGLHDIDDNDKNNIIKYIKFNLNNIVINDSSNLEELLIYFTICKILKNIELYKNYLLFCIDNINKNLFNLNTNYCMFNDVLEYRICEKGDNELDKVFSEYYIFNDFNTYAIDNKNKCLCLGYILALSKNDEKWNVSQKIIIILNTIYQMII